MLAFFGTRLAFFEGLIYSQVMLKEKHSLFRLVKR